jgi:magnesium chelatase family protein
MEYGEDLVLYSVNWEKYCSISPGSISGTEMHCDLDDAGQKLLEDAFKHLDLSARAYYKILRVARTIADLENSTRIEMAHIAEAIGYRTLDRKYWNRQI